MSLPSLSTTDAPYSAPALTTICDYKCSANGSLFVAVRDCQAFTSATHQHDFIQLWYVRKGLMHHTFGDVTFLQRPGCLLLVPPLFEHAVDSSFAKDETEVFSLDISEQMIFEAVGHDASEPFFDLIYLLPLLINSNVLEPGLYLTQKTAARIEPILAELSEQYKTKRNFCSAQMPDSFVELLQLIAIEYQSTLMPGHIELLEKYRCIMQNTFHFIKQNYMKKLRVEELCKQALMSKTPFYSIFKLATGKSPNDYLRHLRIMYACELLIGTDLSLFEISCKCGFADQTDLGRVFKQVCGISPKQYRAYYTVIGK